MPCRSIGIKPTLPETCPEPEASRLRLRAAPPPRPPCLWRGGFGAPHVLETFAVFFQAAAVLVIALAGVKAEDVQVSALFQLPEDQRVAFFAVAKLRFFRLALVLCSDPPVLAA